MSSMFTKDAIFEKIQNFVDVGKLQRFGHDQIYKARWNCKKKTVVLYFNTAAYWYYNFYPSLPLMKREGRP